MRAPGEVAQHPGGILQVGRLAVHTAVERHRGVHAERHAPFPMRRVRLPLRVRAHELGGLDAGGVPLDVRRFDDVERDPELLEDRPPLRARRCEGQAGCPGGPYLLRRPLARPVSGHVVVVAVGLGVSGRLQFDEPLDLEPVRPEQIDELAVREVVLDALPRSPASPTGASRTADGGGSSRPARRPARTASPASSYAGRRAARRSQQPRGFGDPAEPDRPRARRRTRSARGRRRRRQAARPRRSPRRAGSRARTRPACVVRSRAAPASGRRRPTRAPSVASRAEQ